MSLADLRDDLNISDEDEDQRDMNLSDEEQLITAQKV